MKVEKVPVLEIDILSDLLKDYILEKSEIAHLYDYSKDIASFRQIIKNKAKESINRQVLVSELKKQYVNLECSDSVAINIDSLESEKCFTVTTAHQLCLFTGPLYFIYKSISTIKLALMLKEAYPDYHFVPVFWIGSEDHDFEEVNHMRIDDKKIVWNSEQGGAVGRMKNKNIIKSINELSKIVFGNQSHEMLDFLKNTFKEENNYSKSFISFINYLFGEYGLIVLEQDNFEFKKIFSDVIYSEIFNNLIEKNIKKELNFIDEFYKVQATPRSINIFYLMDGIRERIVFENDLYVVNNTSLKFSRKELEIELENHPDRFSPNVLLRPLYQESILPNLAYIGGGGELAYWLQLKNSFHSQQRKMPMLLLRDMALQIDVKTNENIEKIQLDKKCLFKNIELLINDLVELRSSNDLYLNEELKILGKMFKSVRVKTTNIDKSLEVHVLAQEKKLINSLKNIERKMLRAEKKNHKVLSVRIRKIKSILFPQNTLQERHQNFLPYYKKYRHNFFEDLLDSFNPLDASFKFFIEEKR